MYYIMTITFAVIFTLVGLATGSFLNVCIDRLPQRKSLAYPPSHCDACGQPLKPVDLVPVVSYLWLRGRCRYCGARIPVRVLLVEALTGLLFLLAFWRFGLTPQFGITAFWCCIFLVIIFIDMEHQLILHVITIPSAIIGLVILGADSFFVNFLTSSDLTSALISHRLFFKPEPSILSGLVGGTSCFLFFLAVYTIAMKIYGPNAFGFGDVMLAGLIGLSVGFPLGLIALLIGIILGGIFAIVLLMVTTKGRKHATPYGVWLGMGPIIVLFCGNEILNLYIGKFLT
jgi:leader peptidase (prepilin peptidase)/N-methyltransferase